MKKLIKLLRTEREGATLVTVVIAAAFLITIGAIILGASTQYLTSVYMDRNSTENLYDAEGILAEVRTGLLEYAGDAGKSAYETVLEQYDSSTGSLQTEFAKKYLIGIAKKIGANSGDIDSVDWAEVAENGKSSFYPISLASLSVLTEKSSSVTTKYNLKNGIKAATGTAAEPTETPAGSDENGDLGYYVCYSPTRGYYLTIKNLAIDYNDAVDVNEAAGYRTTIETDIQLTVPDYRFEGDSPLEDAKDFLIITDDRLDVSAGSTTFNGNIYTGAKDGIAGVDVLDLDKNGLGVVIDSDVTAKFNCEKFISRGDLGVFTGSTTEVRGEEGSTAGDVYFKNVKLLSGTSSAGKTSKLTLAANTYVENDLNISDNNTVVNLGGKYIGYSYNETNDKSVAANKAEFSSAILANGHNTTLGIDSVGLSELVLAGRAFVERGTDSPTPKNDIILGQSLAAKSDQVAYLLPDQFITTGHNPVTSDEIATGWSYASFRADGDGGGVVKMADLVNSVLYKEKVKETDAEGNIVETEYQYLDKDYPVTGNFRNTDGGYVFLYLNFASQEMADKYFERYYKLRQTEPTADEAIEEGAGTEPEPEQPEPDQPAADDGDEDEESAGSTVIKDIDFGWDLKSLNTTGKAYITGNSGFGAPKLDPDYYLIAGNVINDYYAVSDENADFWASNGLLATSSLLDKCRNIGKKSVKLQTFGLLNVPDASLRMRLRDRGVDRKFADPDTGLDSLFTNSVSYDGVQRVVTGDVDSMFTFDIADFPNVNKSVDLADGTTVKVYASDGSISDLNVVLNGASDDTCLIISKGDVTINKECKGLIIAGGNVNVESLNVSGFTGLIIAAGEVKVSNVENMRSNFSLVSELFELAQEDNEINAIFGNGVKKEFDETEINKCIRYQNWEKNLY